MTTNQADKIVNMLKHVRQIPPIYLGGYNSEHLIHFLHGVDAALAPFGLRLHRYPNTIYEQVVIERGWEYSASPPIDEMRSKGFNDQEIVHEMLTIEIESWKRQYQLDDL